MTVHWPLHLESELVVDF